MRNRTEDQVKLVMIRHGKTASNRERRYLGKTDEPLCEEGRRELTSYIKRELYPPVDAVFVSPMKRCRQTAAMLYPGIVPSVIEEWTEMDFGAFEGKTYEELKDDGRYQRWIDSGGMLPCPAGETKMNFSSRCERGFRRMLAMLRKEEKTVGMVVHGGTLMALLGRYGGGSYFDYQADNGRGYICACKDGDSGPELTVLEKI